MNDKQIYVEFTKRDNDKRIVEGYASTETEDSQGEIVKLTAIEKALPGYMKWANLREMHQYSAVGKTVRAHIDKARKGLYIVGKIVDNDAWEKVKEGVYNAFSIGGKVLKKVNNVIEELSLNEISLVDRPANPEAVFTMIKLDTMKEPEHMDIMFAGDIIDLARNVRMLLGLFESTGRSTVELNKVLNELKSLASKVLNTEDKKKFDKVLYEIGFQELERLQPKPKIEKEEKEADLKKYINESWVPGYFSDMKKALG